MSSPKDAVADYGSSVAMVTVVDGKVECDDAVATGSVSINVGICWGVCGDVVSGSVDPGKAVAGGQKIYTI